MRASELLGARVVDGAGRSLGPVRDLRVVPGTFEIAGLVVGGGRLAGLAHAWGYAEGRADGPWILRAALTPAAGTLRFVPSARVTDWGPGRVTVSGDGADLPRLGDEVAEA